MSDILFRCPTCTKSLAVDEGGVGLLLQCTDCGTYITPPESEVAFACPFCRHELSPTKDIEGQEFLCPYCSAAIRIPHSSDDGPIDWSVLREDLSAEEVKRVRNEMTELASYPRDAEEVYCESGGRWLRLLAVVAALVTALFAATWINHYIQYQRTRTPDVDVSGEQEALSQLQADVVARKQAEEKYYHAIVDKWEGLKHPHDRVKLLRRYLRRKHNAEYSPLVKDLLNWEDDQLYEYVMVKYDHAQTWAHRVQPLGMYLSMFPRGRHYGAVTAKYEVAARGLRLLLPIETDESGQRAETARSRPVEQQPVEDKTVAVEKRNENERASAVSEEEIQNSPVQTECADNALPDPYAVRKAERREKALVEYGGNAASEMAVLLALRWLKEHQMRTGAWQRDGSTGKTCRKTLRPAMTGLALLAFFAHGDMEDSPEFGKTIAAGIRWLVTNQEKNGHFKGRDKTDYSHPIATFALCEAYGMHRHLDIQDAAERAVAVIIKHQGAEGWGYRVKPGRDTSYSAWCVQALKAAKTSGLQVEGLDEAMKRSVNIMVINSSPSGGFGYQSQRGEKWLSGAGVLSLQLLSAGERQETKLGLAWLRDNARFCWEKPLMRMPLYNWYYITQARFNEGGECWNEWNSAFRDKIIEQQLVVEDAIRLPDGLLSDAGSWQSPSHSEDDHGAVYATALCALMLQVYYRYDIREYRCQVNSG